MIKRWFKKMFLDLLFDREVQREIVDVMHNELARRDLPPPPPRPSKYNSPFVKG